MSGAIEQNRLKGRKKMNKNCKTMMGAMVLMASFFPRGMAIATSCAIPPTCEQLGYTMKADECGESPILRCPFALSDDNQVYCPETVANIGQDVSISAILYGDGTVTKEILSGKTPIGIVFDETNRLALALTDVNSSGAAGSSTMYWSSSYCDVPSLTNCVYNDGDTAVDSCGVDGRANTDAILATNGGCSGTTYAANGANLYNPSGCAADFCKKNKWFLPSMRDLAKIYANKSVINASLSLLGSFEAKTLTENYYWSSTERANATAWRFGMGYGHRNWTNKNTNSTYVRPVVKF